MYGVRSTRASPAAAVRSGRRSRARMWHGAWVRVTEGDDGITCEVMGLGHRFRQDRTVSLGAARRLAAHGLPLVIRKAPPHRDR